MSEQKIDTHFIKNNDFRTILTTSVYGGITINGLINANFCVDRTVIPLKTVSTIEGVTLAEKQRESKEGIIKEVQIGVLMDITMAKQTIDWLQKQIKQVEELQQNK